MEKQDSLIYDEYRKHAPRSAELYNKALETFPNGVTHDARYMQPFPIYIESAQGSKKWDVDGNEYIDYWVGHGALLLGQNHPVVLEAIRKQLEKGTHYGACHELEIEWGEMVRKLVPSADRVRFTNSGTEATLMTLRLARAFTGKSKVVKFEGHFHGWHDHLAMAIKPPYDGHTPPGILDDISESTVLCPPNDVAKLGEILRGENDIACVIIEPTGATFGTIPTKGEFLEELRDLTAKYGVLLIFDEVITGFRCAPGGAQEYYNVIPDLTTLAKILAGGLPGGAVAGRKDIMELLEFKGDYEWDHFKKIAHPGTYNANPMSSCAGVTALKIISDGKEIDKANRAAAHLREELNKVIEKHDLKWCVYGDFSDIHIYVNPPGESTTVEDINRGNFDYRKLKGGVDPDLVNKLRAAMLIGGADINSWPGGMTSSVHSEEDIRKTAQAFDLALSMLKEDGVLR